MASAISTQDQESWSVLTPPCIGARPVDGLTRKAATEFQHCSGREGKQEGSWWTDERELSLLFFLKLG
jgi:hypothetical protein